MKKIFFLCLIALFIGFCGCFFTNKSETPDTTPTNTPKPTVTPTPKPTDASTIDDVEISFDKNLVTFTSKEETETVYLTVDLNGYMGKVDFEYDVTGYGNVNIASGKSEIEPGKFTIPLYLSPIENCTLIITYKIKGTYESTDITIVTNFFE